MKDILPFYTMDGSVGLYSNIDDDIYHSVFGAYSEAYDKFIMPANIDYLLNLKKEIKVLDICYGIGYNSKSFLKNFLKNFSQKKSQNFLPLTENIATIHTDNINSRNYNDTIYTDNIVNKNSMNEVEVVNKKSINEIEVVNKKNENLSETTLLNKISEQSEKNVNFENCVDDSNFKYKIQIDAIDKNEILMKAAPLFAFRKGIFNKQKSGISKVDKYLAQKNPNSCKHELMDEVNYIILINLVKQYGVEYLDKNLKEFLLDKKFRPFFDKKFISFMPFYQNEGYNLSSEDVKSTFLHNIYYRYVSKSYKNTLKVLENNEISFKCIRDDARNFIKDSLERYDLIFLDAFTPSKCPSLWTYDFFKHLYQNLSYDGMLLTYSSSSAVRSALLKANFYVGKIFNKNENKFTGTIAVKNPDLIVHNFDNYEKGLLKTKAGIVYRDETLQLSDSEIIEKRHEEVKNSDLISSSQYIKNFKELSNVL